MLNKLSPYISVTSGNTTQGTLNWAQSFWGTVNVTALKGRKVNFL